MTAEAPCLKTNNAADRISLRGVRVRSRLAGMSQRTTVEQTFINAEARPIEAVYTFPLPDDAAVCGFEAVTGDRVLTGKIEEREQAIELYSNALAAGDGAMMLERERPDVFTFSVGNLKPGQAVRVTLSYVAELPVTDNVARVVFPTTIAPRYATATDTDPTEAMIDADALNPAHVLDVPYGLTLEVDVDLGRPIKSVASPTHEIRTESAANDRYRVTFAAGVSEMNRDVVLKLELPGEPQACAQVSAGPDDAQYLAVTFVPEIEPAEPAAPQPADVVFVLDCSGSMQGDSIARARTALELCLRSLRVGDRFNICRFGSTFELMHPEGLVYDDATFAPAVEYVRRIDANLGGTEMHAPLKAVFDVPTGGRVRDVILLTDGQVTNEPAILRLAGKHRAHHRLFTFGIGAAPSASLIRGLARETRGAAEFIAAGEDIAEKVLRMFSRMASPAVSDVEIDFDGAEATVAPAAIAPIFDGDALTVFARIAGRLPRTVTLRGFVGNTAMRWTVPVRALATPGATDIDTTIATAWARRMIEDLEPTGTPEPANRAKLLRISQTFNVLCSLTAFVALEHRSEADRTTGQPALRRVPVMLAQGWGGIQAAAGGAACLAACAPEPMLSLSSAMRSARAQTRGMIRRSVRDRSVDAQCFDAVPDQARRWEAPSGHEGGTPYHDDVLDLLALQAADGSFALDKVAYGLLAKVSGAMNCRKATAEFFHDATAETAKRIENTVLVLVLFRVFNDGREATWRRAYDKGTSYLAKVSGKPLDVVQAWVRETATPLVTHP